MEGEFSALLRLADSESATAPKKTGLLCKDGSVHEFYLSIYPLRDRSGRLYSYMLNLSARKMAMPAILNEEFRRIFKFSNDSVAITDRDGSIIDVNQTFLDTYGYERHEVLGKNPRVLKSSHSSTALYEKMWKDILDPERGYWRGEIINMAKGGREVPVLLSINAIKDSKGEINHFLGIAFNMTREKELDKLRKMYIDYVVHDIRGPLTSITVNSELLLMQLSDISEKTKKKIEVILASANKVNTMASDMLEFSRAQSGNLHLKKEKVSLTHILKEAFEPFKASGKTFLVNGMPYNESSSVSGDLRADSEKLQRALYNVFSNAFKHAASRVSLKVERLDEGYRFMVSDDGKGIPAEEADRIFDAFYQTEDGIKTGGAGLGLSIVKCFVEAHGGNVWVEPGNGSGLTFGFLIPV
jgi:PAS domain S-box-containing protein